MLNLNRHIYTLGAFSSLCLLFPLITSAQEATPGSSPKLVSGLLQPKPTESAIPATAPVAIPEMPAAVEPPSSTVEATPAGIDVPNNEIPAAIEPPLGGAASDALPDASAVAPVIADTTPSALSDTGASGGAKPREFQGDELGYVLRLLARQAKIDLVVGETIQGTVTMRLENKTAMQAIQIIVQDKGLYLYETDGTFFIKTEAEKKKEPTDAGYYTFSYGRADACAGLLQGQILSGVPPQVDPRTNTIFYREFKSNMASIAAFLQLIDKPTRQVMIEARLVEVNANPKQSYGINWGGVLGGSSSAKTFKYGAYDGTTKPNTDGTIPTTDFAGRPEGGNILSGSIEQLANQFAIVSAPQLSLTLRFLNEDTDAEFLANPRIVTADNQEATIKIVRSQPVPQLNFNEQTATAVFGGFEEKEYGNTLIVKPSINKDDYVTLSVKPEISNKVSDAQFTISGATVFSPIIDTRTLDSNVLIKSGDTLAIGGLLQDETTKTGAKVPILGDIPGLGYLFQEKVKSKTKRNLLIFVTPTIIEEGYGTGLENQVTGLTDSGDEFADSNGWRNNAKGSIRVVPTRNDSLAAHITPPGVPPHATQGVTKITTRYQK